MTHRLGDSWTLHRRDDGTTFAALVVTDTEFPWLYARVDARDGLAEFRPLFAEDLRLVNGADDGGTDEDVDAWDRAYEAIRNAVTLRYPNGADVPEFLLHLDGDEAWWRWSDESFGDETA